jgi:hypothetical protein
VLINEILPANQNGLTDEFGELEDWIELFNPTSMPINVGGYYLSDDPLVRNKWMIPNSNPDSTTIPAQGWLLFWADNDEFQGMRHTGFRLSNNGEYLSLSGPDGYTLADEMEWSYIAPDTSIGRSFDGAAEWILFAEPTPNESNGSAINVFEHGTTLPFVPAILTGDKLVLPYPAQVEIIHLTGQTIYSHHSTQEIPIENWPSGIYILRMGKKDIFKFVVR